MSSRQNPITLLASGSDCMEFFDTLPFVVLDIITDTVVAMILRPLASLR
jgi:hypothetical protein